MHAAPEVEESSPLEASGTPSGSLNPKPQTLSPKP